MSTIYVLGHGNPKTEQARPTSSNPRDTALIYALIISVLVPVCYLMSLFPISSMIVYLSVVWVTVIYKIYIRKNVCNYVTFLSGLFCFLFSLERSLTQTKNFRFMSGFKYAWIQSLLSLSLTLNSVHWFPLANFHWTNLRCFFSSLTQSLLPWRWDILADRYRSPTHSWSKSSETYFSPEPYRL